MKKEKELEMKKSYIAPKMDVVELTHQANLMESSPCMPGDGWNCGEQG